MMREKGAYHGKKGNWKSHFTLDFVSVIGFLYREKKLNLQSNSFQVEAEMGKLTGVEMCVTS